MSDHTWISGTIPGNRWQNGQIGQTDQPPGGNAPKIGRDRPPRLNNVQQDLGNGQQVGIPLRTRGPAQTTIGQRLMTFETLMERLGAYQPKSDIKIGGMTLWRHSVAFKEVQRSMQDYETALNRTFVPGEDRRLQMEDMRGSLTRALAGVDSYIEKHQNSRTRETTVDEMRVLKAQIEGELGLLDQVEGELQTGGEELAPYSINELMQAKRYGLSLHDCRFGNYKDQDLDPNQTVERYRGGNVNYVSKLVYNDGTSKIFKPLGPATTTDGIEQVETKLGGSRDLPRSGVRNLTACAMDRLLGTNLLCKTEIGMHNGRPGLMMEEVTGKPCKSKVARLPDPHMLERINNLLNMTNVQPEQRKDLLEINGCQVDGNGDVVRDDQGRPLVFDSVRIDLNTDLGAPMTQQNWGELHRQLIDMQWLDGLNAEYDRHAGNFLINRVDGHIKITGIDNDACFGTRNQVPIERPSARGGCHNTGIPDLIDRRTYDKLTGMDFDRDVLPELQGRLSEQEIAGVRGRFDILVARARELDPDYVVNDWTTWTTPDGKNVPEFLESRTKSWSLWKFHFTDNQT